MSHLVGVALWEWFFGGMLLFFMWSLWLEQRRNKDFKLSDLVTGENGRVSGTKFASSGAFVISSWGFVHLVINDKMSEWYFLGYMSAWALSSLANKVVAAKFEKMAEGSNG